ASARSDGGRRAGDAPASTAAASKTPTRGAARITGENSPGRLATGLRRSVLPLLAVAGALAAAAPAAAPKPGLWGRYLLAYASCDASSTCREELAQSRDGIRWAPVVGFVKRRGQHPVAVRRGSRLYVFDGLTVRRFTVGARSLSELAPTAVSLDSAEPPAWSDVLLDGGLVLVYAVPLETGGLAVRTATEQAGSDGTVFVTDP